MGRLHWIAIGVCILTAAYVVQEPLLRPNEATVLSWLNGHDITVVPVADYRPPKVEKVDSAKIRDLKHESGTIWRTRIWVFRQPGLATYTFRYPYRGELNSYKADIRYDWGIRPGWILREPQFVNILGTENAGNQYSRSRR
jgi:hypothetical protein